MLYTTLNNDSCLYVTVYYCMLLEHIYVHTVTPKEVMDLEKTYWGLKGSGKFDCNTFELYITPPVPQELCEGEHPFLPRPLVAVFVWYNLAVVEA